MRCSIRMKKTPPSGGTTIVPERHWLAYRRAFGVASVLLALAGCRPQSITETTPTAPPLTRIAVLGDFGGGGADQQAVADAILSTHEASALDYLITTGDNFYSDDVTSIWTEPYGWLEEESVEVLATWGNHDIETETRRELVEEHLNLTESWYTRDLGPILFVALDSNQIESAEQLSWLKTVLTTADEPAIVAFHHPPHSCGAHGSDRMVQDRWEPLFIGHDVVLILNGHEHDYERIEVEGLTHVITGGGGRPLRPIRSCPSGTPPPDAANDTRHHFVLLDVSAAGIDGQAISADSEPIDRFSIAFVDGSR